MMEPLLQADQIVQIERLATESEDAAVRRRAQVLLSYHAGLQTKYVAEAVGLSRSQVRHWRRAFLQRGMAIFPGSLELEPDFASIQEPAITPAEPRGPRPSDQPLTLEALRARYQPERRRADHLCDLAATLFDQTQPVHHLAGEQRRLLTAAAFLHDLGTGQSDQTLSKAGQEFILAHKLQDFSEGEKKFIAAIVRHQSGKVRRRALATLGLTPPQQQEAMVLAALLRMTLGLDRSQSQSTHIDQVTISPHVLHIMVSGLFADQDAKATQRNAQLWTKVCHQAVRVTSARDKPAKTVSTPPALPYPKPQKNPGIEPWDPMAEAGRKILLYHFAEMLRHEDGTRLGEDIEELHDMRVATRRMRAAFDVFGESFDPKAIKPHLKGLRATGRALGRVRDLDVFMEKAQKYLETLPGEDHKDLDPLLQAWAQDRERNREQMLVYLDSKRFEDFKQDFNTFLQTPGAGARRIAPDQPTPNQVQHMAPVLIYRCQAAVRAYESVLSSASIDQLHALRIEFKKLRYTVEFFREVLGVQAKEVINDIKTMQDHLGDLNDSEVACQILREFIENWEARQSDIPISERQNPEPVVAYLAAKHAERHRLMVTFSEAWAYFNRPAFREHLAAAISVL